MTTFVSTPRSQQVTATMSQSIAAATNFDYSIPITIFCSTAVAHVIGTTTISGSAGYPGAVIELRPASATGRAVSVTNFSGYPGAFCTSLISQLSATGMYGTTIQLNDAWINNATSSLVFQFRNTGGVSSTATARITATVLP